MKRLTFFFIVFTFFLFLTAGTIFAQSNPRIAVIPLNPVGVSERESKVLTELFETGLVNTEAFQVIEQNRVQEIVEAQKYALEDCTDEACAVEFGRLLAADRIVLGTFSSVGGQFIINAKIIDVETGQNIKADKVTAATINEMTEKVELLAFKLAGLTVAPSGAEERIAREFGELFINTEPSGADIFINGVKKGRSPELFSKVPLGRIRIEARKGDLYAERMADVGAGIGEMTLALERVYGNLFIKSSESDVDVFVDGDRLGPLDDGFFRDLRVGRFTLTLEGEGLYWEDEVEIAAGESSRIEAYPRAFGTIDYSLPEGASAEITGKDFREVVRGSGRLSPVWTGSYAVTVEGENYVTRTMDVTLSKNERYRLAPDLSYTEECVRGRLEARFTGLREKVASAGPIEESTIEEVKRLTTDLADALYTFPDMIEGTDELLETARSKKEEQEKERLYARLARDVEEAGRYLAEEHSMTEEELNEVQSLSTDILTYVSAGTGGLSLGISVLLFAAGPNPEKQREEIDRIDAEIRRVREGE